MSVAVELPPVESLSFDSDFTAFLRPDVDDKIKRAALKQLFRDPRFNVMDGLDTYIDDYTKADPIPPDMLAGLLRRFAGNAPDAGPAPAVAAAERGAVPAPAPTHLSPSNGEEDARAERSAGQGEVSTPATGDERAPAEGDVGEGAAPPAAPGESRCVFATRRSTCALATARCRSTPRRSPAPSSWRARCRCGRSSARKSSQS
jgi:hypothetical protein